MKNLRGASKADETQSNGKGKKAGGVLLLVGAICGSYMLARKLTGNQAHSTHLATAPADADAPMTTAGRH